MGLPERVAAVAVLPDRGSLSNWSKRSEVPGQDAGRQMAYIEFPRLRPVRQDVREGKLPRVSRVKTIRFARGLKDKLREHFLLTNRD